MYPRPLTARFCRHTVRGLALAAVSLGLAVTVLTAPITAQAAPLKPGSIPRNPGGPSFSQPDFVSYPERTAGTEVPQDERFSFRTVVANRGQGGAVPFSVTVVFDSSFRDVAVQPLAGLLCEQDSGAFSSRAITCTGELAPGTQRSIRIDATATGAVGTYAITSEIVSVGNSADVNPANNAGRLTLHVL